MSAAEPPLGANPAPAGGSAAREPDGPPRGRTLECGARRSSDPPPAWGDHTSAASSTSHHDLRPSPWIERFAHLVPAGARVLDLAAGHGRHARFFASRGADVLAVDRDAAALETLHGVAGVARRVADLESGAWPLAGETFDAIVVVNYLHRALFPHLLGALRDGGAFLYETFAVGNERFGRPSNPDFLLREGELLDVVRGRLVVVAFEQGRIDGARPAVVQRIAAVGPKHAWPPAIAEMLPISA